MEELACNERFGNILLLNDKEFEKSDERKSQESNKESVHCFRVIRFLTSNDFLAGPIFYDY